MGNNRTCVDAPLDASIFWVALGHVVRCGRVFGLEDAALHVPRARMEIADQVHFAHPRFKALRSEDWFS